MSYMFTNCYNLTTLDLSNFYTTKVSSFAYMFSSCSKLNISNLSNFDTSSGQNMAYMFFNCKQLNLSVYLILIHLMLQIWNICFLNAHLKHLIYLILIHQKWKK